MAFIRKYAILLGNVVQRVESGQTKPVMSSPFSVIDVTNVEPKPVLGDVWNGSSFSKPLPPPSPVIVKYVEVDKKRGRVVGFYEDVAQRPAQADCFVVAVPLSTPVKIGQLYTGSAFIDYPQLFLVLGSLMVDVAEELVFRSKETNKIRVPEGATVTAPISIRMFSPVGPVVTQYNADYETPIISTDGRERIVTSKIRGGIGEVVYKFDENGIWSITEEHINRNLVPSLYLSFEGLFVTASR